MMFQIKHKLRLRPWIRRLHLTMALITALIISVVGLTGSLYVFAPEISAWLRPDLYQAQPTQTPLTPQALAQLVTQLELQHGQQLESLQWPYASRSTFLLKWQGSPNWYFLDPATALLQTDQGAYLSPLFDLIYEIHSNLLLQEAGRYLTAGASLLFAFFCLATGWYLWWPAKGIWHWERLRRALTIHRYPSKRFNYDVHAVSGFWFSLPLFIMGLTGAFYVFERPMQQSLDWVLGSEPAPADFWQKRFAYPIPAKARLSSGEAILRLYQLQPPGLQPRNLWHAIQPEGTFTLGYQQRDQIAAGAQQRLFMQLDPYSGQVLKVADPQQLPLASRLTSQYLQPLHFGEFAGLTSRILWLLGGLVPLLLTITGTLIWWHRQAGKIMRGRGN